MNLVLPLYEVHTHTMNIIETLLKSVDKLSGWNWILLIKQSICSNITQCDSQCDSHSYTPEDFALRSSQYEIRIG